MERNLSFVNVDFIRVSATSHDFEHVGDSRQNASWCFMYLWQFEFLMYLHLSSCIYLHVYLYKYISSCIFVYRVKFEAGLPLRIRSPHPSLYSKKCCSKEWPQRPMPRWSFFCLSKDMMFIFTFDCSWCPFQLGHTWPVPRRWISLSKSFDYLCSSSGFVNTLVLVQSGAGRQPIPWKCWHGAVSKLLFTPQSRVW